MARPVLLVVGFEGAGLDVLRDALGKHAPHLRRAPSVSAHRGPPPYMLVVGPDAADPVREAQACHALHPEARVVLVPGDDHDRVRAAVTIAPRVPRTLVFLPLHLLPERTEDLRRAVEAASQVHRHRHRRQSASRALRHRARGLI